MPPNAPVPYEVAVLDGVLERVTFANPETGYTIARIAPDRGTGRGPVSANTELVTAVGPLLGAQIGESLRLRGRWTSHVKYGRQFEVHSYTTVLPATEQGIRRYLGSGMIKGIGPVMAERMVNHFGVDIMHVIDDEPDRLIEVDGLGPKRCARIKDAWAEQKAIKEVMVFLQGVGVSTSLAVKIYKKYGDESVDTVTKHPYQLAADVWGIGFKTADTIAASVGIAKDSPERIMAGLAYTLSEAADDGHCFLPPRSSTSPPTSPRPAWPGSSPRRARSSRTSRWPRKPSQCGPSTCRPSFTPNGPSPTPCAACTPPPRTGLACSDRSTGTRRSPG
jgi:exodeoxyribonuclease V alpha subunit